MSSEAVASFALGLAGLGLAGLGLAGLGLAGLGLAFAPAFASPLLLVVGFRFDKLIGSFLDALLPNARLTSAPAG
jgi:hypothetical protein